jgi:hypothetical protein
MRSALLWDPTELIVVLAYYHVEIIGSIFSSQAIQDKIFGLGILDPVPLYGV